MRLDNQSPAAAVLVPPLAPIALLPGREVPFHPDYFRQRAARSFWRLSYQGGAKYKSGKDALGEEVFIKHEQESQQGVKRRKRLAVYRNYCKPIVNKYNDFVFIQPVKRDSSNQMFAQWSMNVDSLGTPLHEFMRLELRQAAVEGVRYCLVESTKAGADKTQAQAQAAGDRLFLIGLDADRIIHWTERAGMLAQALVYLPALQQVRLYDSANVVIGRLDPKDSGKLAAVENPVPHGYASLPVVKICALPDNASQIEDIAECNKSLFNMDALLREELARQTFTQWLITGIDAEDMAKAEAVLGGRRLWCINKQGIEARQLGSDISQAESIRKTIDGDIKEIYRLSGLHNPDVLQKAESGRALHIRWNDVEITAAAIADHAEQAENRIIDLWVQGMGGGQLVAHSDYPEEFDTEDLAISLQMTLAMLPAGLPPLLKRLQIREFAARAYPKMSLEEKQVLEAELQQP